MTYRKLLIALPILLLIGAVAIAAPAKEFRNFNGTWMCPECAAMKQVDSPGQCEAKGHRHALKLDGGQMLTFLDSPRAATLIHGGGRDKVKIQVCGLYDGDTKTLDVDAYRIDDVWSTWCGGHGRMDSCRSTGEPGSAQNEGSNK